MRRLFLVVVSILFISVFSGIGADTQIFLKVSEPPAGKAKNCLLFDLEQLTKIIESLRSSEETGSAELTNQDGTVLANICTIEGGEIKWINSLEEKTVSVVLNNKSDFEMVLGKVKEKSAKPGLLIQYSDAQKTPMANQEIAFAETPDIFVEVTSLANVAPGDSLAGKITIEIENKGTLSAQDISVEILISGDLQMPEQPVLSETFKDDMLLEGGKTVIPSLNPGERITVKFPGTLKIPSDTPFGKYFVGVIADSGNKIIELNKDNNRGIRMFMIAPPEPKRISVLIPETQLVYNPATYDLSVTCAGLVLSETKEWRKCNIKPDIFQVKHAAWEDFLWEINTTKAIVNELKGGNFCKRDGVAKVVNFKIDAPGGTTTTPPSQVTLSLSDCRIEYSIQDGKLKILANESQLAYLPLWQIAKAKPSVYQVKNQNWGDVFLEIDAVKKEVRKVTGGKFGYPSETGEALNLTVDVEK